MPAFLIGSDLHEQLEQWMAEGLIDARQAARIEAAEAQRPAPASPGSTDEAGLVRPAGAAAARRMPLVVEALGYLGGTLAIVASFYVLPSVWPRIPASAELAIAAVAAAVFGIAGAILRPGDDPSLKRLASVLWLISAAGLAAFTGLLTARVWGIAYEQATLVTALVSTAYAVLLWWRTRAALQHLAMFASTAVVIGTAIALTGPGLEAWGPGLGVWVLAALWGTAAHRGYLVPRTAGYIAAGIAMLISVELTTAFAAWPALALGTVAGLLFAGVALGRILLLGLGSAGVIVIVPQLADRYLPTSIGTPLALFSVGLCLVAVAIWLARSRKKTRA